MALPDSAAAKKGRIALAPADQGFGARIETDYRPLRMPGRFFSETDTRMSPG